MEKFLQRIVQSVLDVPDEDAGDDGEGRDEEQLTRSLVNPEGDGDGEVTKNPKSGPNKPTCHQGLSIFACELLARAHFYPSLLQGYAAEKLSIYPWYSRIDESICLGAIPTGDRFAERVVARQNVVGVISMNEDYELRRFSVNWTKFGVEFLQLATRDIVDAPSQANIRRAIQFVDRLCGDGGNSEANSVPKCVYVHCKAGRTRSATVVACYLIHKYKWTPAKAMAHIQEKRSQVLIGPRQQKAVDKFYQTEMRRRETESLPINGNTAHPGHPPKAAAARRSAQLRVAPLASISELDLSLHDL